MNINGAVQISNQLRGLGFPLGCHASHTPIKYCSIGESSISILKHILSFFYKYTEKKKNVYLGCQIISNTHADLIRCFCTKSQNEKTCIVQKPS